MTATPSNQPAGPDDLATRLARIGLPSGGVKDRLAVLPGPLRELHRRLLGAFLTEASPPAAGRSPSRSAAGPGGSSRPPPWCWRPPPPAATRAARAPTAAAPTSTSTSTPAAPRPTCRPTPAWPPSCSTRPRPWRRPGGSSAACSIPTTTTTRTRRGEHDGNDQYDRPGGHQAARHRDPRHRGPRRCGEPAARHLGLGPPATRLPPDPWLLGLLGFPPRHSRLPAGITVEQREEVVVPGRRGRPRTGPAAAGRPCRRPTSGSPAVVPSCSPPGPPKLGRDGVAQRVEVDPERGEQRPGRTAVAIRQPDVGGDPPVPPRHPHPARRLAHVRQHPEHQVLGADRAMAKRPGLLAGQLQGALGEERGAAQRRPGHPCAPPSAPAGHPPGRLPHRRCAECLLGAAPHGFQVDPQRAEEVGVAWPWRGHYPLACQAE